MKALHSRVCVLLPLLFASSTLGQVLPYLFETDGTGTSNKLDWQTDPGMRYDLWISDHLASWQHVSG